MGATMRFQFRYTGIRVRDLDGAIDFFTKALGMTLKGRIPAPWNKGEFANLASGDGKHWLELNWYADDSPTAGPFREGEELDHLGFEVDDFDAALEKLDRAGYPTVIGPIKAGDWNFAFVRGFEGLWFDIFSVRKASKAKAGKKKAKPRKRKGKT